MGETTATTDEREFLLNASEEEWFSFLALTDYEDNLIRERWDDVSTVTFRLERVADLDDCRIYVKDADRNTIVHLNSSVDGSPEVEDGVPVAIDGLATLRINDCDRLRVLSE